MAKFALFCLCLEAFSSVFLHFSPPSSFGYTPPLFESLTPEQEQFVQRVLKHEESRNYLAYDRELGWTIRPSARMNNTTRSNRLGIRSDREYSQYPEPESVRILAFGDSFTHGDEVGNEATWTRQLEALSENLEVLNFGVPAYGLDQALLRYRRFGSRLQPQVVLIGYLPEDLYRQVNVFRTFYLPGQSTALAKPRFKLNGERLDILPNPLSELSDYEELLSQPARVLPELGRNDAFYQHYRRRSPLTNSSYYWRSDTDITYRPLLGALKSKGETVWDAREAIAGQAKVFAEHGHYSEAGNKLLAQWLESKVNELLNTSEE